MKLKMARIVSKCLISLFVMLLCAFFATPVFSSEKLLKLNLNSRGDNAIVLFPYNEVKDFGFGMDAPEIARIDFYDWELAGDAKIVLAPHPMVEFMRVSQVSHNPDVVRAVIVFVRPVKITPNRLGKNLVLNTAFKKESPVLPTNRRLFGAEASSKQEKNKTILDSRVSLSFDQEDLMTILSALAAKFNLRIFADSGVKGKFSVQAQDVTLRDILKNLLLQRNFQYTIKGRNLTVISLGGDGSRIARELLFRDLSLRDALQTLSKMMNVNIIIHDSVEDKNVNFYIENLSLDELFDLLVQTNDLVKMPRNNNTFVILTKEAANTFGTKQFRTYKLVNTTPEEVVEMISSNKSLSEKVNTENLSINERINALSAYDTVENLNLIEEIIASVDEKVKQAVIEVKLVEINRTSAKELGVQLDQYMLNVSNIGNLPSNYTLPASLKFIEGREGVKVLASPKIRVVHGKSARIFIGSTVPIPYYDYATASSSSSLYPPTTQTLKRYRDVDVGIELNVTPTITRDNEISLDLITEITNLDGEPNEDGQYRMSTKSTETHVRIKDGETIVLGGLISHNNVDSNTSPAFINKIPILRSIFTVEKSSKEEREMIMLVTPRLVNLDNVYETDENY